MVTEETYLEQIQTELKQTPAEYLPALLSLIHSFRESICITNAEDSFSIGWRETQGEQHEPIKNLWDDMGDEA